ncbi:S26 family signal peptidase [Brevundimonas sp.]|uniref:S26 family signal peptidase n=1 Tax=Brevundimonas sp. TaxID=1871086 RepID=UPI0028ABC3D9|nr:S26 family signal peptidase [Brevundimonas sp.]
MTSPLDNGSRWTALAVTLFLLGALALAAQETPALALVNESPSVPRGLYTRMVGARPDRGALVAVDQPDAARPYLSSLGMPPDVKLIKRVAAERGDRVCLRGAWLEVGGRIVAVRLRDGRGTRLQPWIGCRRLDAGEVFLLGDTPGSYDSRYFGPVRVTQVDGVFRETLTW